MSDNTYKQLILKVVHTIIVMIININDLNFDQKSFENTLIFEFAYTSQYGTKS